MIPSTLQRYALRETLFVAVISVVALTAMIFVGMSADLMRRGLSVTQLLDMIPLIIAMSLPYALPSAMLLATVFVFGRFAGNNELNALRSAGINLNHIIFPLLALGAVLAVFSFALNHYLMPMSLARVRSATVRILSNAARGVGAGHRQFNIGDYVIYVGGSDPETSQWRDIAVVQFANDIPATVLTARTGGCVVNEETEVATLYLYEGAIVKPRIQGDQPSPAAEFKSTVYRISLADKEFSLNDPKYLQLAPFYERMKQLEHEAAELRKQPEYAAIRHPKTVRKRTKSKLDAANRVWSRLRDKLETENKALSAAEDDLGKAEVKRREAEAEYQSTAQRAEDAARALADSEKYAAELREEIRMLSEQQADPERIERQRKELAATEQRIGELKTQVETETAEAEKRRKRLDEISSVTAELGRARDRIRRSVDRLLGESNEALSFVKEERSRRDDLALLEDALDAESRFHFRNAGAVTCLIFMLIGIPLGILSRHGNIILAFVISFGVVLIVYYPLIVIGRMLSQDGFINPMLGQWMANLIVGGAGIGLIIYGIRR